MKKRITIIVVCCLVMLPQILFGQDDGLGGVLKFAAKNQSIEEIKKLIINHNYDFKVKRNWVFDMPAEEKNNFFNIGQMDADKLRELINGPTEAPPPDEVDALPDQFDLRDHDGHAYIGPIRNQGTCGSCYAFAIAAAAESSYNLANKKFDGDCVDFSEAYTAFCLSRLEKYKESIRGCNGATLESFFSTKTEGVGYEKDFPYTGKDPGKCPDMSIPTVKFKGAGVTPSNDIDAVKWAIYKYGAVWATVATIPMFQAYSEGVYEDPNVNCDASDCMKTPVDHAVSLVGWDDNGDPENGGYWILRNSWGPDWGENGYMRIRYRSAFVLSRGVAYLIYDDNEAAPQAAGRNPSANTSSTSSRPSEKEAMDILLK